MNPVHKKIVAAYKAGKSLRQCGVEFGMTHESVRSILLDSGIPMRPVGVNAPRIPVYPFKKMPNKSYIKRPIEEKNTIRTTVYNFNQQNEKQMVYKVLTDKGVDKVFVFAGEIDLEKCFEYKE